MSCEHSTVLFHTRIHSLGLSIGLMVERHRQPPVNAQPLTQSLSECGSELWSSIGYYRLW
jgi:hypothetical protein